MRIHITGMSPRMVSWRAREQTTFARTLEQVLVSMGHTTYRGPDPADDFTELVLAGVTSALSPAVSYAMVGLEQIGWALKRDVPLLLFVDDPQMGKTRAAAQSARRDPDRLYAPYLMSKRVKQSRHLNEAQRRRIDAAIELLSEQDWPPVLVPLHPWASPAIAGKRLGVVSEVVPVDVSSAVRLPDQEMDREKAKLWLTDWHYSDALLEPERVSWPVVPIDSTILPSPAHVYSVARGIHQGAIDRMPGWWTPTPTYVAHACTVYLSDSEETEAIGTETPYYLTSDQVESLTKPQHRNLAAAQAEHLKETSWDQATLSSHLADSIGRVSSSGKRATKKARRRTS